MRPRSLLVLLLVVLALGTLLWFWERELPGSEEREESAKLLLGGLEAADVEALVLEDGDRRLRLVRAGGDDGRTGTDAGEEGQWRFAEPVSLAGARADAPAVAELLSALAGLVHERELEDVEPAEVGLDAPRARVVLERAAGEDGEDGGGGGGGGAIELEVGGEVPASRHMVVRVGGPGAPDGGGVFLVDRALYGDLVRAEWRARDLIPFDRGDVAAITLAGPQGRVELVRQHGGPGVERFDVVAPFRDRADEEGVDLLLAALADLEVDAFQDGLDATALAGIELEPPRGTIEVWASSQGAADPAAEGGAAEPSSAADDGDSVRRGEPFRILVGAPIEAGAAESVVHLSVDGQVVTARTLLREPVERTPAEWASRRLTELRPFMLVGLVVEEHGEGAQPRLSLTQVEQEWHRDGDVIEYTAVSELLNALSEARAEAVGEDGAGLGAPELSLHLRGEASDEREGRLELHGAGADGLVPVVAPGRDRVLRVPAEQVERIREAIAAVRRAETMVEARPEPEGAAGEDAEDAARP